MAPQKVVSSTPHNGWVSNETPIKGLLFNVQFIQVKLTKNSYIKGLLFNVRFIQDSGLLMVCFGQVSQEL
jgi:hypothetical protein